MSSFSDLLDYKKKKRLQKEIAQYRSKYNAWKKQQWGFVLGTSNVAQCGFQDQLYPNRFMVSKKRANQLAWSRDELLDDTIIKYNCLIEYAEIKGYNVAADNLRHYLNSSGEDKVIDVKWFRSQRSVNQGEKRLQDYFEEELTKTRLKSNKENLQYKGFFVADIVPIEAKYKDMRFSVDVELKFAIGTCKILGIGEFNFDESSSAFSGKVTMELAHYGDSSGSSSEHPNVDHPYSSGEPYDWHNGAEVEIPGIGKIEDTSALMLENNNKAAKYILNCKWKFDYSESIMASGIQSKWDLR